MNTKIIKKTKEIKFKNIKLINKKKKIISKIKNIKILKNKILIKINLTKYPSIIKVINLKTKIKMEKKSKKKNIKTKEIKFRINTGKNDYNIKIKNLKHFLNNGNKVKITIYFKGREIIYKKNGISLMNKIYNDLNNFGKLESLPKFEGKYITSIINSNKKNEKKKKK